MYKRISNSNIIKNTHIVKSFANKDNIQLNDFFRKDQINFISEIPVFAFCQ